MEGEKNFAVSFELILGLDRDRLIDPNLDFRDPKTVAYFFRDLKYLSYEQVFFLFLNDHGNCLGHIGYRGAEHECSVVLREVVSAALLSGATIVIDIHNHPSVFIDGQLKFSPSDIAIFDKLKWMFAVFRIKFSDMILISGDCFTSYQAQKEEAERLKKLDAYQKGDLAVVENALEPESDKPMFIDDLPGEPLEDAKANN